MWSCLKKGKIEINLKNRKSIFSFPDGGMGQNVIMFEAETSSSVHIDIKKKKTY